MKSRARIVAENMAVYFGILGAVIGFWVFMYWLIVVRI